MFHLRDHIGTLCGSKPEHMGAIAGIRNQEFNQEFLSHGRDICLSIPVSA